MIENPKIIGQQMRQAVRTQIQEKDPPIAYKTYRRLMKRIKDEEEVIRMMAHCLLIEMVDMMKEERSHNEQRYARMLRFLPDEQAIYNC